MLELINDTDQLKKIILGDVRFEMKLYYEYFWLDCKNNIFCLEINEDRSMKLIGEPYLLNNEPLWCTLLDQHENEHERDQLEDLNFADNFPLKLTTNLGDILEVCPIS